MASSAEKEEGQPPEDDEARVTRSIAVASPAHSVISADDENSLRSMSLLRESNTAALPVVLTTPFAATDTDGHLPPQIAPSPTNAPPVEEDSSGSAGEDGNLLMDKILLQALQNPRDRIIILKIDCELEGFINSPRQRLDFPAMPSYHRLLVHRVAQYFKLQHTAVSTDGERRAVILFKTPESCVPVLRFSDLVEQPESATPQSFRIMQRPSNSPSTSLSSSPSTSLSSATTASASNTFASSNATPSHPIIASPTSKGSGIKLAQKPPGALSASSPSKAFTPKSKPQAKPAVTQDAKSIEEREEAYRKAKERIWAEKDDQAEYAQSGQDNARGIESAEVKEACSNATSTSTKKDVANTSQSRSRISSSEPNSRVPAQWSGSNLTESRVHHNRPSDDYYEDIGRDESIQFGGRGQEAWQPMHHSPSPYNPQPNMPWDQNCYLYPPEPVYSRGISLPPPQSSMHTYPYQPHHYPQQQYPVPYSSFSQMQYSTPYPDYNVNMPYVTGEASNWSYSTKSQHQMAHSQLHKTWPKPGTQIQLPKVVSTRYNLSNSAPVLPFSPDDVDLPASADGNQVVSTSTTPTSFSDSESPSMPSKRDHSATVTTSLQATCDQHQQQGQQISPPVSPTLIQHQHDPYGFAKQRSHSTRSPPIMRTNSPPITRTNSPPIYAHDPYAAMTPGVLQDPISPQPVSAHVHALGSSWGPQYYTNQHPSSGYAQSPSYVHPMQHSPSRHSIPPQVYPHHPQQQPPLLPLPAPSQHQQKQQQHSGSRLRHNSPTQQQHAQQISQHQQHQQQQQADAIKTRPRSKIITENYDPSSLMPGNIKSGLGATSPTITTVSTVTRSQPQQQTNQQVVSQQHLSPQQQQPQLSMSSNAAMQQLHASTQQQASPFLVPNRGIKILKPSGTTMYDYSTKSTSYQSAGPGNNSAPLALNHILEIYDLAPHSGPEECGTQGGQLTKEQNRWLDVIRREGGTIKCVNAVKPDPLPSNITSSEGNPATNARARQQTIVLAIFKTAATAKKAYEGINTPKFKLRPYPVGPTGSQVE